MVHRWYLAQACHSQIHSGLFNIFWDEILLLMIAVQLEYWKLYPSDDRLDSLITEYMMH